MSYTQDGRIIQIDTPLGKDVLLLKSLGGTESISKLFTFSLELLSENPSLSFDKIVGQKICVSIKQADDSKRYISGVVSRFSQSGGDSQFTYYHAEVVPWLWLLTRTANCRIFQKKTVPDIIKVIFDELGFSDYRFNLTGTFDTWEYCVQYRETSFNFVSRLMEQEGIFYFFEHEKDKHTLILGNPKFSHKACPGQPKARLDFGAGGVVGEDVVSDWHLEQEFRAGKYSVKDYNFETPGTDLGASSPSVVKVADSKFEIFDYPGEHEKKGQGDTVAKIRMEEEEATYLVGSGSSDCRGFIPGYKFDLDGHQRKDMNQSYLLTEVHHSASVGQSYYAKAGDGEGYSNSFSSIPLSVPFRPARVTPKPFVQGPQTAVVVGKKDEEIWIDNYGRVKVKFHWDRDPNKDENSSCWIRVSQVWAGKMWGALFHPRMGQEVIVDFLEGDPDQPIITGRVYNADQIPPANLPDQQNIEGLATRSTKQGDTTTYNMLTFDDTKGKERLRIHAERHKFEGVEKDSREWVGNNRHLLIDASQFERVNGNRDEYVVGNHLEKIDGDQDIHVKGFITKKVDSDIGIQALAIDQKTSGDFLVQATEGKISLKAGTSFIVEAETQITLKVGANYIVVSPAGVTIKGTMVNINSAGDPAESAEAPSDQTPEDPKGPDIDKSKI